MASTDDLFQQRADECRGLAATARKASDKAFWLGLVERWRTLEIQRARQRSRMSQDPLADNSPKHSPGRRSRVGAA
jgi:hypothetical protein